MIKGNCVIENGNKWAMGLTLICTARTKGDQKTIESLYSLGRIESLDINNLEQGKIGY